MFYGCEYFIILRDQQLLIPTSSAIRTYNIGGPDYLYFVNERFLLESYEQADNNMSAIGMGKGVYQPEEVLKSKMWSVTGLDIWQLFNPDGTPKTN